MKVSFKNMRSTNPFPPQAISVHILGDFTHTLPEMMHNGGLQSHNDT